MQRVTFEKMPRPERWDVPFGPDMTEEAVNRLLTVEPFRSIDGAKFPGKIPLRGVLHNDARFVRYKAGDIIVREGDYGDAAYFVVSGAVRVVLSRHGEGGLPPATLGRRGTRLKSWAESIAQFFRHRVPEYRDSSTMRGGGTAAGTGDASSGQDRVSTRAVGGETRIFLQDVPSVLDHHRTARIVEGEFFGEIAALGRTPRTASVFAETDAELLEIRWQGLRELRRYAPAIKDHIDRLYRQNSLLSHLRETPIFAHLAPEELAQVASEVRFETYGDFDWYGSYRSLAEKSATEKLEREPVIALEGDYPNGVLLLRAGFARVSTKVGHGEMTMRYLGRGEVFGLEEIAHNWKAGTQVPLQTTLRALGYVDVLFVPTLVLERYVLPRLPANLLPAPIASAAETPDLEFASAAQTRRETEFREFVVENRFINGQAAMLMDLDRCIHCDACVEACAATHDNNPRFLRHGAFLGRHLVANACMHCADPVCMIGCPTGAIHRSELGPVVINDTTCIGCGTCARSCPYDNIRMVEIRDEEGRYLLDEKTNQPLQKATKCDLCVDQRGGPACARACPHDALIRVDLHDTAALQRWLSR